MSSVQHRLTPLKPFGLLVEATTETASILDLGYEAFDGWVREHRYVVLRGFGQLSKQDFALFGQQLGEPLQWPFGAINELKVTSDPKNYIFTNNAVPLHWDGAFRDKVPYLILFQCLTAPRREDLGGTVFADSVRAVAKLPEHLAEKLRKVSIRYTTEKLAHYGGTVLRPFFHTHVVTGENSIRYAEPVEDLNPVEVTVPGWSDEEQEELRATMHDVLYDPEISATHYWEDGDFVVADNHALLHGREAFLNPHERHIQRINLLPRPPKPGLSAWIRNSITIRRLEFLFAEIPIVLIPLFLATQGWHLFGHWEIWAGIFNLWLLFNVGDMVNCLADRKLDAIYKSHLSNAVYELGERGVRIQLWVTVALAVIVSLAIAWSTHVSILFWFTLLGLLLAAQYSLRPFHFKSRGILQLFALWGIIFFGPMLWMLVLIEAVQPHSGLHFGVVPELSHLLIAACYGMMQMGIIVINNAEDYTEDKANGLNTLTIALGLRNALYLGWGLVAGFGLGLTVLLHSLLPAVYAWPLQAILLLPMLVALAYILVRYAMLIRKLGGKDDDGATREVKYSGAVVPKWLKITAFATLWFVAGHWLVEHIFGW